MIELKTPAEIEAMHAAGVVVADILAACRAEAKVGVSLSALDRVPAIEVIRDIVRHEIRTPETSP